LSAKKWLEQGERLPPTGKKFEFQTPLVRTVPSLSEDVVIWLELFASDSKTVMEDHFPKDHPQNQSKLQIPSETEIFFRRNYIARVPKRSAYRN